MNNLVRTAIIAICMLACGLSARAAEWAIDKNSLKDIPADEQSVLAYFVGPAYYLLDSRGENVRSQFQQKPAYLSDNFKSTIFFFLSKADAERYKAGYENQLNDRGALRETTIGAVLAQQYRTVGTPIENNPRTPDFLLFRSFPPGLVLVEFLVSMEDKTFHTVQVGKRAYTPAFFFQPDAVKLQAQLNARGGKKYDRIYLDFGSFLRKFIRPQAKRGVPIVVFGEDAEKLVPAFEKAYSGNP